MRRSWRPRRGSGYPSRCGTGPLLIAGAAVRPGLCARRPAHGLHTVRPPPCTQLRCGCTSRSSRPSVLPACHQAGPVCDGRWTRCWSRLKPRGECMLWMPLALQPGGPHVCMTAAMAVFRLRALTAEPVMTGACRWPQDQPRKRRRSGPRSCSAIARLAGSACVAESGGTGVLAVAAIRPVLAKSQQRLGRGLTANRKRASDALMSAAQIAGPAGRVCAAMARKTALGTRAARPVEPMTRGTTRARFAAKNANLPNQLIQERRRSLGLVSVVGRRAGPAPDRRDAQHPAQLTAPGPADGTRPR